MADLSPILLNAAIVLAVATLMEGVAWATHKYVMHGRLGWGWHRSHHEPHDDLLEKNDLYGVVFGVLTTALVVFGSRDYGPLYWTGVGMTLYGFVYFVVHDGLVHQRWPFRFVPRNGYLKRLVQAHRLHHATEGKDGGVSFGFVYARPVRELKAELRAQQGPRGPLDAAE